MRINSIDSNVGVRKNPNFKSNLIFDIGGSHPANSLKSMVLDKKGTELIQKTTGIVNQEGRRFYDNAMDFITQISRRAVDVYNSALKINPKDNKVNKMVFFVPGSVYDKTLMYADNIKNPEGTGTSQIDFSKMIPILKESGMKLDDDFDIKLYQDSMGTGLAIAKKLYDKGMLHEGDHYAVAITGGGCGISNIRMIGGKAIVDATGSSYFTNDQGLVKIANAGASVSKLILSFCNSFDIPKDIGPKIASCGIGQVATSEIFMMPKTEQGEKLKGLLLDLKKLAPKDRTDPNSELVLKPMYELYDANSIRVTDDFSRDFKHARHRAIEKYARSLARFAPIKENECANGFIITGPLGFAIDKVLRKHHDSSLAEMITQKVVETYNSHELDQMRDYYNFKVICNPEFALLDNTECRDLVLNAQPVGEHRYNWLALDLSSKQ